MSETPVNSVAQTAGIDLEKMKQSPYISGATDYSEVEDTDFDETKIFWMGTNANLSDTPQEQLENKLAIQEQIKKGILDEVGLPVGFTFDELGIPKEAQERLKMQKAAIVQQQKPGTQNMVPVAVEPPKKVYKNKWERKLSRQQEIDERKRAEKLAKANKLIEMHQQSNKPIDPSRIYINK